MVWMYTQKQSDFRWFFNILNLIPAPFTALNGILSFFIFTVLLIMEFLIPFAIWVRMRRHKIALTRTDSWLLTMSVAMVFSTFFVGYGIYNNYAMRSTILPVWIGLVVLSRYVDQLPPLGGKKMRIWVGFWLVMMTIGSVNEIAAVWKQSYRELRLMATSQSTRTMVYQLNQGNGKPDHRLQWRILDTNASYYHLLERPVNMAFSYHENDIDLIGPPPSQLWQKLDWSPPKN